MLVFLLVFFLPTTNEDDPVTANQPLPSDSAEQRGAPEERPSGGETGNEGDTQDGTGNGTNKAAENGTGRVAAADTGPAEANEESAQITAGSDEGIPDVSGQPLEEAARAVTEAGYTVAAIRSEPGAGEPGTVTGTEPSAGTDAPPDTDVVLTTVAGPAGSASPGASAGASDAVSASAASASASASPAP
jgi:hypothetical protein